MFNKTLPIELSEFKNLGPNTPTTHIDIPEKAENRVPTDRAFLIAFCVSIILFMPFLIYSLTYADIRRFGDQVDNCGNICGANNEKYDQWNCTGQDFTDKKLKDLEGNCVSSEFDEVVFKRLESYFFKGSVIFRLILSSFIAVGVSVLVIYIFRYAVHYVIWTIIALVFIMGLITVVLLWIEFSDGDPSASLALCLICTLLVPCYVVLVYFYRQKIALVIVIITEAAKAVFAMPSMIVVPISTFVINAIIVSLYITTAIYMMTAGELTEISSGHLKYVATNTISATTFFNTLITIWALLFINGLQYMVVGGAVSEWYFAADKSNLIQPVKKSITVAYKFHLGTIAFGSLVILVARLVRRLVWMLLKSKLVRKCIDILLSALEEILKYLTYNAFIVTAMHGQPFLKSGKRAASLIGYNLGKSAAIRLIGYLTMYVGVILVGFISLLFSMILFLGEDDELYFTLVCLIMYFMSLCIGATFFVVFQSAMDTIFICFCEDSHLNDGMARPYAMSQDLLEFVENIKKVYGVQQETVDIEVQSPHPV